MYEWKSCIAVWQPTLGATTYFRHQCSRIDARLFGKVGEGIPKKKWIGKQYPKNSGIKFKFLPCDATGRLDKMSFLMPRKAKYAIVAPMFLTGRAHGLKAMRIAISKSQSNASAEQMQKTMRPPERGAKLLQETRSSGFWPYFATALSVRLCSHGGFYSHRITCWGCPSVPTIQQLVMCKLPCWIIIRAGHLT